MKRKYYGFHRSTIYKRIAREKKAYYARMADPSVPSTSSVVDQPPEIEMPELVPEVCTEPVDISEDAVAGKCFLADLREFCLEAQMPLSTTKKLFRMLRPYHPEVPKDPRTLLQTPRTCISKPLNKGNYVHLRLERGPLDQLHSLSETSVPEMRIQLHIDGMKIFKGSNQGLWPILARVRHPVVGQPFIVGVFSGPGKPDPLDDFLGDCVGELLSREMPAPAPVPATEPACSHQAQSDTNDVNFRLASLENKVDFLAEQMVALNNSVRQLQATMTDAVSALERGATAADVGPSRLHLPLCTAEAYEDFVRRLTTEAKLADKAVQIALFYDLALAGGHMSFRIEKLNRQITAK
nr:unnamed protein product [Spirometra erinaceieuropaei]